MEPGAAEGTGGGAGGARHAALGFILITIALDVLGFGVLIPVAPKLIEMVSGEGERGAARYVGMLVATYALMQFVCAPILGSLSDRYGRRPVLLIAMFGSGLDYFAMALAPTLWVLFVTRAINGTSGASFTVANAYIADVTPPEKRAAAFGMMGAAFGLGFVIGPVIGGHLGDSENVLPLIGRGDIHYPFYLAGALSLINWLYGLFVLPESLPRDRRRAFDIRRANPLGAFGGLGRYPLVAGLAGAFFLLNLAQYGLQPTWVLYTAHRYGWSPSDVSWSLAAVGTGAAVVQGGLARKIVPALGERRAMMVGLGIAVLAYAGYGLATQGWMIYAVIVVGAVAGIVQPAAMSLITRSVRPDEQGAVQGALTSVGSIAAILGPLLITNAFAVSIAEKSPVQIAGLPFYVCAVLAVFGWMVAGWAVKREDGHVAKEQMANSK